MNIKFLAEAKLEYESTVLYYETARPGFGDVFVAAFKEAIGRIKDFPEAWDPIDHRYRRCMLKRFPFGVIYERLPDFIQIVAVMDLRRDPDYWKPRVT